MAPQARRVKFPEVVIERDSDTEESSSEEEVEDEEDEEDEQVEDEDAKIEEKTQVGFSENNKGKAPITISLKKVCKVCTFFLSLHHVCVFFLC